MAKHCLAPTLVAALLVVVPVQAQTIPKEKLFEQSLEAARQALEFYGAYDAPDELDRVAEIGYRIAAESGYQGFPITFHVIDMLEPNAFALPGGQVFVTRGMLDLGLDDDELAGLLGHEIAHVVLEHGIKMQRRATLLSVLTQAALIGVMITADQQKREPGAVPDPYGIQYEDRSQKGDLIQGTYAAGVVLSELLLRDYSREFEDQADEEGQRWVAGAGFDPSGTKKLMENLLTHLPESREYGYWRTHPFFSDRQRAAEARGKLLAVGEQEEPSAFRARTQATLVTYRDKEKPDSEVRELLRRQALTAWPQGPAAEGLRREELDRLREELAELTPLSRDYGDLLAVYDREIGDVESLTPESPFLDTVRAEREELVEEKEALYPEACTVLAGDVVSTPFFEVFLSNYPEAPEVPQVALSLGEAYSRLKRETDAVEAFLLAASGGRESPEAEKARQGLRRLTPYLDRLSSLQELADRGDEELEVLAMRRLEELASRYEEMDNGAEYLRRFPESSFAPAVRARIEVLAEKAYGEVLLYQAVGDSTQAIERIQKILTHAPFSKAAERLRDAAVIQS